MSLSYPPIVWVVGKRASDDAFRWVPVGAWSAPSGKVAAASDL